MSRERDVAVAGWASSHTAGTHDIRSPKHGIPAWVDTHGDPDGSKECQARTNALSLAALEDADASCLAQ